MRPISEYIIFVFVCLFFLWVVNHCFGGQLMDDADARTNPYHHVTP